MGDIESDFEDFQDDETLQDKFISYILQGVNVQDNDKDFFDRRRWWIWTEMSQLRSSTPTLGNI